MKRIRTVFLLCFLCFAFSILFLGQASALSKNDKAVIDETLLEPQANLKFNDVPVPVGFKMVPQESYSFESEGVRIGLIKYQGKADPDRLVSFFKEQMAMNGWHLLNIVEFGQRMLNFERESESCIVNMLPRGNNISLTIALGPKSQLPSNKADKPIK